MDSRYPEALSLPLWRRSRPFRQGSVCRRALPFVVLWLQEAEEEEEEMLGLALQEEEEMLGEAGRRAVVAVWLVLLVVLVVVVGAVVEAVAGC